ncbi:uncharacterized protein LOC142229426 [Haematobia irritans]|uniref:uncharacterized protein LOC142229426 n=1 Tax=Haematobia irritans TaxID=7368 RepID=UPI003F50083E
MEVCEQLKCDQSTFYNNPPHEQIPVESVKEEKNVGRKRAAMVIYKEIEESLSKWAQEMKSNNIHITAAAAKEKAEEIARCLGQDFKPSAGWLYGWKERENVQFGKKIKRNDESSTSSGNEDILKGLLESRQRISEMATSQHQRFKMACNGEEEKARHFTNQQSSQDLPTSENLDQSTTLYLGAGSAQIDQQTATSMFENSSPMPNAKKVPYSYDPVYVLTSTGRYRKEKTFLTLLQKLEILQRMKHGERRQDLIIEYKLSQSAMSQIVADEKKILQFAAIGHNLQMKRVRGGIFKEGEVELNEWVLNKMAQGETITRSQVKGKAKEIADRMQIDFKASTGWLEKWKARMNMDFNENQILHRKIPSYVSNADEDASPSNTAHVPEAIYCNQGLDGDNDEPEIDIKKELAEAEECSFVHGNDDIDIKPIFMGQHQYIDLSDSDSEPEDIKPTISHSPSLSTTSKDTLEPQTAATETLHQKILNWLSKYNIGPTASIELLTLLHPIITEVTNP